LNLLITKLLNPNLERSTNLGGEDLKKDRARLFKPKYDIIELNTFQ